jgi:hypothetical protein
MPTEETHEEECTSCALAVLGGATLSVCREVDRSELDCEKLAEDFVEGRVSIQELIEKVRPYVTDPVQQKKLDDIEDMAQGNR